MHLCRKLRTLEAILPLVNITVQQYDPINVYKQHDLLTYLKIKSGSNQRRVTKTMAIYTVSPKKHVTTFSTTTLTISVRLQ